MEQKKNRFSFLIPFSIYFILAVLLILIYFLLFPSQFLKLISLSNNFSTSSQTLPSCKKFTDPIICQFYDKLSHLDTYYTKDITATYDIKTVKKDVIHNILQTDGHNIYISYSENGKLISEKILFNNVLYIKNAPQTHWGRYTGNISTVVDQLDIKTTIFTPLITLLNRQPQLNAISIDTCSTGPCYKYQIFDSKNKTNQQYFYIDKNTYLLAKISILGNDGSNETGIFQRHPVSIKNPLSH